jgi:hypothetical protein
MTIQRHIAFTKLIKAEGRLREFNFRRKAGAQGAVYDIDVSDQYGRRHYFHLQQQGKDWLATNQEIPGWIADALPQIQAFIAEVEP